ncbi:MAG: [protein-PII] uridylyltransferase [Verrucomicrobia bacterium]|nr:[protein-PII] uridylyltransferase [Verrucomicrobiota bacterium]
MRQDWFQAKLKAHADKCLTVKPGAKRSEVVRLYKQFLKVETHRLLMEHRAGAGGREVAQGRTAVLDTLLRHVFDRPTAPISLVAIGGYGRGELNPFSDIDVMFLHDKLSRPDLAEVVEKALYLLWDIGLKVGHSTRTIDEAVTQANADMQSKTSLIESRLIAGDAHHYEKFRQTLIRKCVRGHEAEYIAARMEDQRNRHEKHGDSVYMQEPNVKNGCGSLRDFQNLTWMAFFKYGVLTLDELRQKGFLERAEQRDLERAYDFILRVRTSLHYLTGRACDAIGLALQPRIADEFGFRQRDVLRRTEAFMREYYTQARNVFLLTNALAARMALTTATSRLGAFLDRRARKTEEFDGFVLRNGALNAKSRAVFKEDNHRLLRVFLHAQQRNAELGPELRTLIRQNLRLVDRKFQHAPDMRDVLLAILHRKGQVARILRLMHETGLLGKLIPEFGRLTCLVQHEFFHRYTADEHTLHVIENLDRIIDAVEPPHAAYRKIFQNVEHADVLYLAILLHDVGKAANVPRHAEASLHAARSVATRLRLNADETAHLLFLVRDHLKLAMLSQRRDLDDQATIDAAVRIVKDESNLDLLMLMTFADSIGTGPKMWTDWKQALLWQLYGHTKQALAGPERARNILSRRIEQLYKEVSAKLKNKLPLEETYSHFELMPASYYINTNADTIIHHLGLVNQFLVRQLEAEKPEDTLNPIIEWEPFPAQSHSRLSLCTWDRVGLFSKICGALTSAHINILRAHIYTRGDQVVLDFFDVCDRNLAAVTDEKSLRAAETALIASLTNRADVDFSHLLARMHAAHRVPGRIRVVTIPTVIEFDNETTPTRTIIEIQTEDRLGLLFALTQTITSLGLDISFARISTEKGAAIDTFYVQDHAGKPVTDPDRLAAIRAKLEDAIALLEG